MAGRVWLPAGLGPAMPVRAENPVHGSDQHSCSPMRPAVMITDHVPEVRLPPDHADDHVAAAVPARGDVEDRRDFASAPPSHRPATPSGAPPELSRSKIDPAGVRHQAWAVYSSRIRYLSVTSLQPLGGCQSIHGQGCSPRARGPHSPCSILFLSPNPLGNVACADVRVPGRAAGFTGGFSSHGRDRPCRRPHLPGTPGTGRRTGAGSAARAPSPPECRGARRAAAVS